MYNVGQRTKLDKTKQNKMEINKIRQNKQNIKKLKVKIDKLDKN